ncbi:hypothetical protein ACP70R_006627 [Stipagrostis hirtigluma subsp. patula]
MDSSFWSPPSPSPLPLRLASSGSYTPGPNDSTKRSAPIALQ